MTSKGRTRMRCGLGTALLVLALGGTAAASSTELTLYGRLRAQIDSMLRSPEFRSRSAPLAAEALLEQIYQGLLGRSVDPGGTRTYLARGQRREYAAVVVDILGSREYRGRLPR